MISPPVREGSPSPFSTRENQQQLCPAQSPRSMGGKFLVGNPGLNMGAIQHRRSNLGPLWSENLNSLWHDL